MSNSLNHILMKFRSLFAFSILVFLGSSCSKPSNEIAINGKINSTEPIMLYFSELAIGDIVLLDSVKTNSDGTFKVGFKVSEYPTFIVVESPVLKGRVTLVVKKGDVIELNSTKENFAFGYSVNGSNYSSEILQMQQYITGQVMEADSIYMDFRYSPDTTNFVQRRSTADSLLKYNYLETYNYLKDFIANHPASFSSLLNLYSEYSGKKILDFELDFDVFKLVADSCAAKFPTNSHVSDLKKRVDSQLAKLANKQKIEQSLQPGNIAPPFSLPDISGKLHNTNDLKGKTLILHFWSYSQKPSWDLNASLKEIYKATKSDSFEIVGINIDADKLAWANTVALDKLEWINVIADEKVLNLYNIEKQSKIFVIDKNGKIVLNSTDIDEVRKYVGMN